MSNINILRQFNDQVNNSLYIENINYLDNLHNIVINSIKSLSHISINDNVFIEIKILYGNAKFYYSTNTKILFLVS